MKVKDIIKKQTTVIALAVVLVVVAALGVSYAVFFDVKTNKNNQVITAGTLKLTMTNANALELTTPMDDADGLKTAAFTYTVKNTDSNLPASYKVYVYADSSNAIDLANIRVSLDGTTVKSLTSLPTGTCTDESNNSYTCYQIDTNDLNASESATSKNVRVWISEDSAEMTDKNLSLYLHINGEVKE